MSIDPKQPRVYFWRAEVYERQGQEEEAIQNLQAAVAIDPAFVNAYRKLAQLYRKEGKTKESVEAMSKEKAFQDGQSKRDRDSFLIEMGYPLL
ncbi:MAG: tetratricopeptide repeat protein [Terriglobia bacterium]